MSYQSPYQDAFIASCKNGLSVSEAVFAVLNQYIDGNFLKKGKRKLEKVEQDAALWKSDFWNEVSSEVFETEVFSLALTRYLKQETYQHPSLLQNILLHSPNSLCQAIKYSQVFICKNHPRWHEVEILDMSSNTDFKYFLDACQALEKKKSDLELDIQIREEPFRDFSVIEMLIYASLYAFKYLADEQILNNLDISQEQTEALNQILLWKLKSSVLENCQFTEYWPYKLLQKHLLPFLFTQQHDIINYTRCENFLYAFEDLVASYLKLSDFHYTVLEPFCFDDDYSISFNGKQIVLGNEETVYDKNWKKNGKRLNEISMYWLHRAYEQFFLLGLWKEQFGSPENHNLNRLAFIKALRTMIQLWELYGFEQTITIDDSATVDLFKLLHSSELMSVFYMKEFIFPFKENYEESGCWKSALAQLVADGLVQGENRFPLTFAEENAKIERIQSWTVSDTYPKGSKKIAEIILNFWTNDLNEKVRVLQKNSQAYISFPELYERPILKVDRYLFTLPWLMFNQNNSSSAINNLRRTRKGRKEQITETHRIETRISEFFEKRGFYVVSNYEPDKEFLKSAGEVDLICARDEHLFIFEIKSSYLRKTQKEAWVYKTNTLRKAGLQLIRKKKAVLHDLTLNSVLMKKLGLQKYPSENHIHSWILDTSIEHDHEYFSGSLKVSIPEILIALRDDYYAVKIIRHSDLDKISSVDETPQKQDSDTFYPHGFSAKHFVSVIESELVWTTNIE